MVSESLASLVDYVVVSTFTKEYVHVLTQLVPLVSL